MSTSQRLRGKEGFYLSLKNGSAAALTTAGDDCKSWEITSDDKKDKDLTFAEALAGQVKEYTLKLTGVVSFDPSSLWMYLWNNPGAELAITLGPKGNATAAAGKPTFTFTANSGAKPTLQNEARTSNEGAEFDHELLASSDLTMVTG